MKELIFPFESEIERRIMVNIYDDTSINVFIQRMATWSNGTKDWASNTVSLCSIEEMKTLGEMLVKISKLLVLA